jgi:hypothetical protein
LNNLPDWWNANAGTPQPPIRWLQVHGVKKQKDPKKINKWNAQQPWHNAAFPNGRLEQMNRKF